MCVTLPEVIIGLFPLSLSIKCGTCIYCMDLFFSIACIYYILTSTAETKRGVDKKEFGPTGGHSSEHLVTCELGLDDCPSNEQCKVSSKDSSRSKNGVCQCEDSFSRDSVSGKCLEQQSVNGELMRRANQ